MLNLIAQWLANVLNLSESHLHKPYTFTSHGFCFNAYPEALLISLLYDRDSPGSEPSHKPPPHCCCSAGQRSNKPHSTLLALLHMTDATGSPLPAPHPGLH